MCPWPLLQMMLCKTETKCWDRRDGRKRDSNMKTQQPPQIAGLLRRVDVQGDDFLQEGSDSNLHLGHAGYHIL